MVGGGEREQKNNDDERYIGSEQNQCVHVYYTVCMLSYLFNSVLVLPHVNQFAEHTVRTATIDSTQPAKD